MLWAVWWRPLLLFALPLWWWIRPPQTVYPRLAFVAVALFAAWSIGLPVPLIFSYIHSSILWLRLDVLVLKHVNMILTLGAVAWYVDLRSSLHIMDPADFSFLPTQAAATDVADAMETSSRTYQRPRRGCSRSSRRVLGRS